MSQSARPSECSHAIPTAAPKASTRDYDVPSNMAELTDIIARGNPFTAKTGGWAPGATSELTDEERSLRSHSERIRFLGISEFSRFVWACCPSDAFSSFGRVVIPSGALNALQPGPDGLLFLGATRAGKTSLATHMFWLRTQGDRRTRALMMSAPMYEAMHSDRIERTANYRRAQETDLLLLDDIGTEQATAFGSGCVALLAMRHNANRETWVTTGLAKAQFVARYGAQVFERVSEKARVIRLG